MNECCTDDVAVTDKICYKCILWLVIDLFRGALLLNIALVHYNDICLLYTSADKYPNGQVKVFNWGEYIDEDLIDEFEDEYGIEVIYDTFDTNEAMYPRVEADPSLYDVICPSDYMIEKMIQNDVLQEIDWDQITNKENIGEVYLKSCEGFDPGNKYCVPYTFGTVGILYNKELVDEDAVIDSWDVLWDETYKNDIIMQEMCIRDRYRDHHHNNSEEFR